MLDINTEEMTVISLQRPEKDTKNQRQQFVELPRAYVHPNVQSMCPVCKTNFSLIQLAVFIKVQSTLLTTSVFSVLSLL